MKILLLSPLLLLAACGHDAIPVQTQFQPVYVTTPAPCPERKVSDDLISTRPVPLRNSPKPPEADKRSALSQAQLGKYEALGGWADKVTDALKRCQTQ